MKIISAIITALTISNASLLAAVFQYAVPADTNNNTAFLWISPQAQHVQGVIIAGTTLMEEHFVQDPVIRAACTAENLAVVYLTRSLGGADIQAILDRCAAKSGYSDIAIAPLMFVGHSAGGGPAQKLAASMGERCFGLIQYRGGMPSADSPIPKGIPSVAMMAQFDEFWGTMRNEEGFESWQRALQYIRSFRAADARNLGSFVVEPGAGHFPWSNRNAEYLALFISKAAKARIPADWQNGAETSPALKEIDHAAGWLTGFNLKENPECAAFNDYQGDKAETSWHFDEEMARATMAYHQGLTGKKDQFIKWNDPHWVDAGARFFFTKLTWIDDGQTLKVHPVYADKIPSQYNGQGPRWPNAGEPAGHSSAPIKIKPIAGPLVATGSDTLRFQYSALSPAGSRARITFLAYSEGDEEYRYTEHVGMMPRGFKGLNRGKSQTITFPELADMKADSKPQKLSATSDAEVDVEYYVAYGPAVIEDGYVKLSEIPARATFPIEVKVTACHFGSGVQPEIKTANPVEQTFNVVAE